MGDGGPRLALGILMLGLGAGELFYTSWEQGKMRRQVWLIRAWLDKWRKRGK